jgi:hypothetical protein
MFLAAPLYFVIGVAFKSGLFDLIINKIMKVEPKVITKQGKNVQVSQIIKKNHKKASPERMIQSQFDLLEGPGLVVVLLKEGQDKTFVLSLTTDDQTINLAMAKLDKQKKFQFNFLSQDTYDGLNVETLVLHFINVIKSQISKPESEIHNLVSLLTKSLELPNWNNDLKSLVHFQKASLILLMSTLHSSPMIISSSILSMMVEEEINCFLCFAKLLQKKTKKVSLIIIGQPVPTLLRYLIVQGNSDGTLNENYSSINSQLGFEVNLPLGNLQRTQISSEFQSIIEGDSRFFTVIS